MLKPEYTTKFKKDLKMLEKRNFDIELLKDIIKRLCLEESLPTKNKDHNLSGDWSGCRECHIEPDWLLIYKKENDMITLSLTRTGSHSDLFKTKQALTKRLHSLVGACFLWGWVKK